MKLPCFPESEPEESRRRSSLRSALAVAARLRCATDRAIRLQNRERDRLASALRRGNVARAKSASERLVNISMELRVLRSLNAAHAPTVPTIVLSSWMLMDSFRICTATADEGMHFVVGSAIGGLLVGTSIVQHPYTARSPVGAASEQGRTHATVVEASETGHQVLAIVHSHPGRGLGANHPSGTDLRTHKLWESLGPITGAIWERGGAVRFFTAGRPVRVKIVGRHLMRVEHNLWRIRDDFSHDRE